MTSNDLLSSGIFMGPVLTCKKQLTLTCFDLYMTCIDLEMTYIALKMIYIVLQTTCTDLHMTRNDLHRLVLHRICMLLVLDT